MILSYEAGRALVYIEFDATVREEHASSTTVTEYHVERGVNVADHARPENDRVTVDVVVTNTPIRPPVTNAGGARGGFRPATVIVPTITSIPKILPGVGLLASLIPQGTMMVNFNVLDFDKEFDRPRDVYDELRLLLSTTTLVNLSSPLREYTDMVLRTLTAPRGPADGSSITFSFSATAIRFVDSEIVGVAASAAVKVKSKGPKSAKDATPKVVESTRFVKNRGHAAPGADADSENSANTPEVP